MLSGKELKAGSGVLVSMRTRLRAVTKEPVDALLFGLACAMSRLVEGG
jgi:hypothetical protein